MKTFSFMGKTHGAAMMSGPLRNGAERGHGSVFHAVEYRPEWRSQPFRGPALCGRSPSIMWSSWQPEDQAVTCPRCLRKIAKAAAA